MDDVRSIPCDGEAHRVLSRNKAGGLNSLTQAAVGFITFAVADVVGGRYDQAVNIRRIASDGQGRVIRQLAVGGDIVDGEGAGGRVN